MSKKRIQETENSSKRHRTYTTRFDEMGGDILENIIQFTDDAISLKDVISLILSGNTTIAKHFIGPTSDATERLHYAGVQNWETLNQTVSPPQWMSRIRKLTLKLKNVPTTKLKNEPTISRNDELSLVSKLLETHVDKMDIFMGHLEKMSALESFTLNFESTNNTGLVESFLLYSKKSKGLLISKNTLKELKIGGLNTANHYSRQMENLGGFVTDLTPFVNLTRLELDIRGPARYMGYIDIVKKYEGVANDYITDGDHSQCIHIFTFNSKFLDIVMNVTFPPTRGHDQYFDWTIPISKNSICKSLKILPVNSESSSPRMNGLTPFECETLEIRNCGVNLIRGIKIETLILENCYVTERVYNMSQWGSSNHLILLDTKIKQYGKDSDNLSYLEIFERGGGGHDRYPKEPCLGKKTITYYKGMLTATALTKLGNQRHTATLIPVELPPGDSIIVDDDVVVVVVVDDDDDDDIVDDDSIIIPDHIGGKIHDTTDTDEIQYVIDNVDYLEVADFLNESIQEDKKQ